MRSHSRCCSSPTPWRRGVPAHGIRRVGGHRASRSSCSGSRDSPGLDTVGVLGDPRPVHRRLGDRRRLAEPPDGDRLQGARGRGTRRGGTSGRGESARRGTAADRPGAARCGGPLDVGDRRAGRSGRARHRHSTGPGPSRARGDLVDLAWHAPRAAPVARRPPRHRRRLVQRTGARAGRPASARRRRARRRRSGDAARRGRRRLGSRMCPARRRAVGLPGRAGGAHERDQARGDPEPRRRDRPSPAGHARRRGRRRRPRARRAPGNGTSGDRRRRLGHGLVGMRERVELWGGELSVGPGPGGGYRVKALLPYGDQE